jgi:hypothetical protein
MPTVNEIYQQVLHRPAEPEGLAYWTSVFGDSVDVNELAQFKAAAAPELAQRGALPEDLMARIAAAPDAPVKIGDTWYQGIYGQSTGSGETFDRGPLTSYVSYTDAENKAGGQYTKYDVTGEKAGTGVQQKVAGFVGGLKEAITDPVVLAAILGAGASGLLGGGGIAGGATTGAAAGTGTGLTVGGAAAGTGITAGAGGLGLSTTGAGLGAGGVGAGLTTGAGLTGTGVLTGSGLGTSLLGTTAGALTGTGILAGSTLGTSLLGTGAGTGVTGALTTGVGAGTLGAGALTTGVGTGVGSALSGVGTGVGAGLGAAAATGLGGLTAAQLGALISTGLNTGAGLLQQQTSRDAALAAQAMIEKETAAAKLGAQFRPIGMTTRFGTSNFAFDPVTGRLIDANYNLSPEAKAQQDRLAALANAGLTQAEGAQLQFAPLKTGAESLFKLGQGYLDATTDKNFASIAEQYLPLSQQSKDLTALGSKYIAKTPEDVAKDYLASQLALLTPGREIELANLQNRLQQQGRGGLSVAQGGTYGATTPELQALYNARAMQEAQLAANAQQAGQQQVQFGAGLIGTGQKLGIEGQQFGMSTLAAQQAIEQQRLAFGSGLFNQGAGLMGQYYGGQQAAYAPYTTALGQVQALETAGQQPFNTSLALAQQQAKAGFDVGQLGLSGAKLSTALSTGNAATTNPYSTLFSGLGASPAFGTAAGNALTSLFS